MECKEINTERKAPGCPFVILEQACINYQECEKNGRCQENCIFALADMRIKIGGNFTILRNEKNIPPCPRCGKSEQVIAIIRHLDEKDAQTGFPQIDSAEKRQYFCTTCVNSFK